MTRLVASDLDGTLLRPDSTVSPRTAETLRRIATEGIHVALVTGRPLRSLAPVCEQIGAEVSAVCANGAVVYDPGADQVLRADPLAPELLVEVCRRLREELPEVGFAVEVSDGRELRYEHAYGQWSDPQDRPIRPLLSPDELYTQPAVKLLVGVSPPGSGDTGRLAGRVAACLGGLAEATYSSDYGLVEISATGVTKATGLAWLCERLGVTADEVVAFGDMPNDIPMLTWAGRGVAVGNAHPAVREISDDVTDSNADDGVARYLDLKISPQDPATSA